jgi:hypothetical protein
MISQAGLAGCTIDLSVPISQQKPVSLASPLKRPVHFTESQARDPGLLAKQLTSIQIELAETTLAARSQPIQAPVIFTNLVCGDSGELVTLTHNFGRYAYFLVIGWRGASTTSGHSLVSDQMDATPVTTENMLALRSYVAGTADLMVF